MAPSSSSNAAAAVQVGCCWRALARLAKNQLPQVVYD
jgi:hypothetical protein